MFVHYSLVLVEDVVMAVIQEKFWILSINT